VPRCGLSGGQVHRIPVALRTAFPCSHRRARLLGLAVPAALVVLLALAGPASADLLTPESGGSQQADDIDTLYKLVLVVAIVVFVGVEAALFYSLFRFRARKGAVAAQIRGNTRLEIGWTVGAAAILVVLSVVTFLKLGEIRTPPNSGRSGLDVANGVLTAAGPQQRLPPNGRSLNIEVNGQQYIWRYTYPDGDRNPLNNAFSYEEMVVPLDTTVTLEIRAQDVAHSWWIPKLGGKFDAVPGYTNYTWFKVPSDKVEAGTRFKGNCAELCGRNHANMRATVRAVTPQEYEQYIEERKRAIRQANQAAAQQRQDEEGAPPQGPDAPQATP
jgi:cytochrome c oxidase subunit II